jgi:hypothetical protein
MALLLWRQRMMIGSAEPATARAEECIAKPAGPAAALPVIAWCETMPAATRPKA